MWRVALGCLPFALPRLSCVVTPAPPPRREHRHNYPLRPRAMHVLFSVPNLPLRSGILVCACVSFVCLCVFASVSACLLLTPHPCPLTSLALLFSHTTPPLPPTPPSRDGFLNYFVLSGKCKGRARTRAAEKEEEAAAGAGAGGGGGAAAGAPAAAGLARATSALPRFQRTGRAPPRAQHRAALIRRRCFCCDSCNE